MSAQETEVPAQYVGGEIVQFRGYISLGEDQNPLFQEGERLRVTSVADDGGLICEVVNDKNKPVKDRQADTVFVEEVALIEAAPKAKRKGRGKAKAKVEAKVEAEVGADASKLKVTPDTKAKAKGKTKGKAKAKGKGKGKALSIPAKAATIKHNAEVVTLIEAQGALKAAKDLARRAEETYFSLGGLLMEIRDGKLYEEGTEYEGTKGFNDYVIAELGIEYRKAQYLIFIYQTFRDTRVMKKITPKLLEQWGWAKAKEVARIDPEDIVSKWSDIQDAVNNKSRAELTDWVKSTFQVRRRQGSSVERTRFQFSLIGDAANTVKRALQSAKDLIGEDDPDSALEYVCGEWLNLREGVSAAGQTFKTLDDLIAFAEENFDTALVVPEGEDTVT